MNQSDPRYDWMRQYAEGTASAEVTAQLEQALREDAAFRRLFLEYLNVDLTLSSGAAKARQVRLSRARAIRLIRSVRFMSVSICFRGNVFYERKQIPGLSGISST